MPGQPVRKIQPAQPARGNEARKKGRKPAGGQAQRGQQGQKGKQRTGKPQAQSNGEQRQGKIEKKIDGPDVQAHKQPQGKGRRRPAQHAGKAAQPLFLQQVIADLPLLSAAAAVAQKQQSLGSVQLRGPVRMGDLGKARAQKLARVLVAACIYAGFIAPQKPLHGAQFLKEGFKAQGGKAFERGDAAGHAVFIQGLLFACACQQRLQAQAELFQCLREGGRLLRALERFVYGVNAGGA